jgi:aminoglycoside phosphotransferase (APT) family kinase protein
LLSDTSPDVKQAQMQRVTDVLVDIWSTTIMPKPASIDYTAQMRTRLREVLRRHPGLEKVARETLGDSGGLYDLLSHIQDREASLAPPFSIWIHGDLNANNVVVDESGGVIFIDVHRSRYGDYVQDLSVLLTSALRTCPKGKVAKGVARANDVLIEGAAAFAATNGDRHFHKRLQLGRARALITSARLNADPERAEKLFVEGLSMLKRVAKDLRIGKAV